MRARLIAIFAVVGALPLGACSYSAPDCDSPSILNSIVEVVNGNAQTKALGVTVKEVRGLKESAADAEKNTRTCSGEMELSNGQILDVVVDLAPDPKDPQYYVPTVKWTPRS